MHIALLFFLSLLLYTIDILLFFLSNGHSSLFILSLFFTILFSPLPHIISLLWLAFLLASQSFLFYAKWGLLFIYILPIIMLLTTLKGYIVPHFINLCLLLLICFISQITIIDFFIIGHPTPLVWTICIFFANIIVVRKIFTKLKYSLVLNELKV